MKRLPNRSRETGSAWFDRDVPTKIQLATGSIAERFDSGPLPEKWRAFGWWVTETDGHDIAAILAALERSESIRGKPRMIIAHTVKGKGVSFAENQPAFHNEMLSREQYERAMRELGA